MGIGSILVATLIGACLGVGVHLRWPEAGAWGSPAAPSAQVASEQLLRGEPSDAQRERLGTAVVLVAAQGCGESRQATASVVRVGSRTVILTNAHVVRGSGTVAVQTGDGEWHEAVVLGGVEGNDAAVLELSDPEVHLESMPVGPEPGTGTAVTTVGYPHGVGELRVGQVRSIQRRTGYGGTSRVMLIDALADHGESGGAVLDAFGRVVGLVAARDPSTGFTVAYPVSAVLATGLVSVPHC